MNENEILIFSMEKKLWSASKFVSEAGGLETRALIGRPVRVMVSSCRSISCEELLWGKKNIEVVSTSNCFISHASVRTCSNRYAYVYATLPLKTFKMHIYCTHMLRQWFTRTKTMLFLFLVHFNQSCIATGFESERTSIERRQESERMCVCAFQPREDVKLLCWKTEWKGKKERSCVIAWCWRGDEFHWSLCWLTGNRGMKSAVLLFAFFLFFVCSFFIWWNWECRRFSLWLFPCRKWNPN